MANPTAVATVIINPRQAAQGPALESTETRIGGSCGAVSGRRYYSPALGRFINRDPIEEKGGISLYAFCLNNPVNRWDYLGNIPILAQEAVDELIYAQWVGPFGGGRAFAEYRTAAADFFNANKGYIDPMDAQLDAALAQANKKQQQQKQQQQKQSANQPSAFDKWNSETQADWDASMANLFPGAPNSGASSGDNRQVMVAIPTGGPYPNVAMMSQNAAKAYNAGAATGGAIVLAAEGMALTGYASAPAFESMVTYLAVTGGSTTTVTAGAFTVEQGAAATGAFAMQLAARITILAAPILTRPELITGTYEFARGYIATGEMPVTPVQAGGTLTSEAVKEFNKDTGAKIWDGTP